MQLLSYSAELVSAVSLRGLYRNPQHEHKAEL
jgi:hypothetical protein